MGKDKSEGGIDGKDTLAGGNEVCGDDSPVELLKSLTAGEASTLLVGKERETVLDVGNGEEMGRGDETGNGEEMGNVVDGKVEGGKTGSYVIRSIS